MITTVKKQPKDVNSITQTRLLMIAMRLAPVCALLGWAIGGKSGLLMALPAGIIAAFAVEYLSGGLSSTSVNILYGTGRLDRSMRDQFIATLSQARFSKMSRRHDQAPRRVQRSPRREAVQQNAVRVVHVDKTVAPAGYVVEHIGVLLGVSDHEPASNVLDVERRVSRRELRV